MYWIFLADQWLMIGLCMVAVVLAYRAQKGNRWIREVFTPLLVQLVDQDQPPRDQAN